MNVLRINLTQPKVSKNQGKETLFNISRKTLCHNTFNPTAYRRSDGSDANSLTAIMLGCDPNPLTISYDAKRERADIQINWSLFNMNKAKDVFIIRITGNHDTDIEVTVQILYPIKTPVIELESKKCSVVWGTNNPCEIVIKGKEDVGHDSWKYLYQTKVFVAKVDGFYIEGLNVVQYAGTIGYMLSLNQWERKTIRIKYNYGNNHINQSMDKKLPIVYIYYTTDSVGREIKKKEQPDVFYIEFVPLKPTISLNLIRLQSEYIIGAKDVNIFKATLSKQNSLAEDFVDLRLSSSDSRVIVSKINDFEYVISINSTSFRDILDSNTTIELKASAANAPEVCNNIILTTGCLDGENSIMFKKKDLLSITESSEIQKNRLITLFIGNNASIYSLSLINISSQVLGAKVELREVNLEIRSNSGVFFKNGQTKEKLSKLQDSTSSTVEISFKPDEVPSTKEISIVVTADYTNPLIIPVKIQSKNKVIPRLVFEFVQEQELYYQESNMFKPVYYDNERIGSITVDSIAEENLSSFDIYSLENNPLCISGNSKITIGQRKESFTSINDKLSFDVFLSGILESQESFVIKSGQYSKRIELKIDPKLYNLPQIVFDPLNTNLEYQFENTEKKYIGTIKANPIDSKERVDVDYDIILPEEFCFEDDAQKKSFQGLFDEEKIYILPNGIFGIVDNIKKNTQILFKLKMCSSVLEEVMETPDGDVIIITPIKSDASPFINLQFENEPDESGKIAVSYSDVWLEDEKNQICEIVLGNNSLLPYSPNESVDNDFVEFSNIRICDNDCLIVFDDPGCITIENGGPSYTIPVYLDCTKWDGKKKEIAFSCVMDVKTASQKWDNQKDDYCIVLKEDRNDKIFSLDLGTTGIVMAKQDDYEISLIQLQDAGNSSTFHIEKDNRIISSLAIIYKEAIGDTNYHQLLLSPTRTDYKNEAKFIFVPAKFVVGQKRIPYVGKLLKDIPLVAFDTVATNRINEVSEDCIFSLDANRDEESLTPELYLQLIYENILNRIGEEKSKIKKLIVTYPNTYTQNILERLRQVVEDKFSDLYGFVEMVPESDAVVAYYFNSRLNCFSFDKKIQEQNSIRVGQERVLIYDMGAGTLDLSLVTIERNNGQSKISANIEKKIGIPIAGNYLDWILFDKFFKSRKKAIEFDEKDKESDIQDKEYKILKNLKDYIRQLKEFYSGNGLKQSLPKEDADGCLASEYVKLLVGASTSDNGGTNDTDAHEYSDLDECIKDYLKLCSNTILEIFLGKQKGVDRLVYSGRGSQFGPLRTAVEKYLRNLNKNLIIDNTIECSNLKTCVAEGAIHYYDMFGSDSEHTITNRNQHLNLGIVYIAPTADGGRNEVHYKEIIHPDDGRWSDLAENQDGTWWREFENTVTVDLSVNNKKVYFIQTMLDEDKIKALYSRVYSESDLIRDNIDWVFINELFVFNTKTIIQQHREKIEVSVKIDKENNIKYSVGGRHPKGEKLVDRIEDNIFYQRSMWPYIDFE